MLKSKHEAGEDSIVFMHLDTRSIPLLYQKGCKAAVALWFTSFMLLGYSWKELCLTFFFSRT